MVVLSCKPSSCLRQGPAPGELCLRVVGTAHDGRIVRLEALKCTIGSAKDCTLRLLCRGVRGLHCILLRGPRGMIARAWASDTRLNGEPFVDALLVSGDRLSLGPVELEVVSAADATPSPQAVSRDSLDVAREQSPKQAVADSPDEALRLARDAFDQQCGAWRAENSRVRAELERERNELIAEREWLARESAELTRRCASAESTFAARLAQLEREQVTCQERQRELEQAERDLSARQADQQARQ